MIHVVAKGSFKNTEAFLKKMSRGDIFQRLDAAAQSGVVALTRATPFEHGTTAMSWSYSIEQTRKQTKITWYNSHAAGGTPVAILLQYGHGTGTGGYVEGRDYINPAIKPIFDQIAEQVWRAVTSA